MGDTAVECRGYRGETRQPAFAILRRGKQSDVVAAWKHGNRVPWLQGALREAARNDVVEALGGRPAGATRPHEHRYSGKTERGQRER